MKTLKKSVALLMAVLMVFSLFSATISVSAAEVTNAETSADIPVAVWY